MNKEQQEKHMEQVEFGNKWLGRAFLASIALTFIGFWIL